MNSCSGTEGAGDEQAWGESRGAAAPHRVQQEGCSALSWLYGFQGIDEEILTSSLEDMARSVNLRVSLFLRNLYRATLEF